MKVQVCEHNTKPSSAIKKGKITKPREDEYEIAIYLDKLKHLLPSSTPIKNRKQSRLEVIQNVIDYISDLQEVLDIDRHTMDILEYETSSITLAA
ncbi:UNVERIFIED_CONTAM: hypothetical protein RMT77_009815 [Armadillidium vulgare]